MKIYFSSKTARSGSGARRGSALIIVIVLLGLMMMILAGNTIVLRDLHKRVKLIEQKQLRQYPTAEKNAVTPPKRWSAAPRQ